ncbi:hypothetical protein BD309DRAFT_857956, partial [Dichomitus squalens]
AALLAYDYIITFNSEVTLFWMGGHLSGATILFLLNRYVTLAERIVSVSSFPYSVEVCLPTFSMRGSMLDTVSERHVLRRNVTVEVAPRSSLIACYLVLFGVTCYLSGAFASILLLDGVSYSSSPEPDEFTSISYSYLTGTIFFLTLLVLTVLLMSFNLTGVATSDATGLTTLTAVFGERLTAILTSRFLIDLKNAQRKLAGSSRSVSLGEIAFKPQTSRNTSRFIGSLGAQLSLHEGDDREDEVEDAT